MPAGGHKRPPVVEPGTLRVAHTDEAHRRTVVYDFAQLPVAEDLQRELAQLFAVRVGPAGTWRSIATSGEMWRVLEVFTSWIARQPAPPESLSTLTTGLVSSWRLSRATSTTGSREIMKINQLLRDSPNLAEGVRKLLLQPVTKRQETEVAYSAEEFDEITRIAKARFRQAWRRIRQNLGLLDDWRSGRIEDRSSSRWREGELLDHIARTGDVPTYMRNPGANGPRVRPALAADELLQAGNRWQRLFLTGEEACSAVLLLVASYGWNATPTIELAVPDTLPSSGVDEQTIYRVALEKRRRGAGLHHETRNLADWGPGSPGQLIGQVIEATAPARELLAAAGQPTDRLIVWHLNRRRMPNLPPEHMFRIGVDEHGWRNLVRIWQDEHGLTGSVNLRRLRKTVVGQHLRVPTQHSQDTHDAVYVLRDPQTHERAVPIIAAGIESALEAAKATFAAQIKTTDENSDMDTVTASCSDYTHGPFDQPGTPCRASFLTCLSCTNAVVMPRHLPKLGYLLAALNDLRATVSDDVWAADWREHYERLVDLRSRPEFTHAEWERAAGTLTSGERSSIDGLLQRRFDAS